MIYRKGLCNRRWVRFLSILIGILTLSSIMKQATTIRSEAFSLNDQPILQQNIPLTNWRRSPVYRSCSGPTDAGGRAWYEVDFDDGNWSETTLPQRNTISEWSSRFFRATFSIPESGRVRFDFLSDDGLWLYIDGEFLLHRGGDCGNSGCVGNPHDCLRYDRRTSVEVFLHPGEHTIALQVYNAHSKSYAGFWATFVEAVSLEPFDLAIVEPEFDFLNNVSPFNPNFVVVRTTVKNVGSVPVEGAIARLFDGNPNEGGRVLDVRDIAETLDVGASRSVDLWWELTDNREGAPLFVDVEPHRGLPDIDMSNNRKSQSVSVYYVDFRYNEDAYSIEPDDLVWTFDDLKRDFQAVWEYYRLSPALLWAIMGRLARSFTTANGYCYGMSSSAIAYWKNDALKPEGVRDKTTYQMSVDEAFSQIREYHRFQFIPVLKTFLPDRFYNPTEEFKQTLEAIQNNQPVLHNMEAPTGFRHSTVVYKIVKWDTMWRAFYYDYNHPLESVIENLEGEQPYGTLDESTDSFTYTLTLPEGSEITFDHVWFQKPEFDMPDSEGVIRRLFRTIVDDLRREGHILVTTQSPVQTLITDELGRRVGDTGTGFVNEIEDTDVERYGSMLYFYLPDDLTYTVYVVGINEGNLDLAVVLPIKTTESLNLAYVDVPITLGSEAITVVGLDNTNYTMLVDGEEREPSVVEIVDTSFRRYLPLLRRN